MKMLMKFILTFVFAACLGGCSTDNRSIGIIGGADGPTAVFVSSDINWVGILLVIGIIAAVAIALIICRKKKGK